MSNLYIYILFKTIHPKIKIASVREYQYDEGVREMEECIDSFEMNIQNNRRAVSDVIGGLTKELRNRNV